MFVICNNVTNYVIFVIEIIKSCLYFCIDWYILRSRHRLLGSLIGSLPTTPRQENQNGLPSLLLPEEVRLIVENGIGRAVEYPSFTSLPIQHIEFSRNNQEQSYSQEIRVKYALQKADLISKLVVNAILAEGDTNCREVKKLNKEVSKIKPLNMLQYVLIHLGLIVNFS